MLTPSLAPCKSLIMADPSLSLHRSQTVQRNDAAVVGSMAVAKASSEVPYHSLDLVTSALRVDLDGGCA